jgi:SAM-dependent methyltransferase
MDSTVLTQEVQQQYFGLRGIDMHYYDQYQIPVYLKQALPGDKGAHILDVGCGFGQLLSALQREGYSQAMGIDVNEVAVNACRAKGLAVEQIMVQDFATHSPQRFDLITMSHVLEHLPKDQIIEVLTHIRALLKPGGAFIMMVPNAQSNTAAYWMYEDFTHNTLFTAGSVRYVLLAAGFSAITFLDPKCVAGLRGWARARKLFFTRLYEINLNFWNRVTSSSYHVPSPRIYSFEIKALARP